MTTAVEHKKPSRRVFIIVALLIRWVPVGAVARNHPDVSRSRLQAGEAPANPLLCPAAALDPPQQRIEGVEARGFHDVMVAAGLARGHPIAVSGPSRSAMISSRAPSGRA